MVCRTDVEPSRTKCGVCSASSANGGGPNENEQKNAVKMGQLATGNAVLKIRPKQADFQLAAEFSVHSLKSDMLSAQVHSHFC